MKTMLKTTKKGGGIKKLQRKAIKQEIDFS